MISRARLVAAGLLAMSLACPATAAEWKAGVARVNITPESPIWMTGYGSRNRPAEGKLQDLWAKALALEDRAGNRSVLITADLCGIGKEVSDFVALRLGIELGLPRSSVLFNVSHTHSSPYVEGYLVGLLDLNEEDFAEIRAYRLQLEENLVAVARDALADLEPAALAWENGTADFGVNRRNNREAEVPALRAANQLKGPVDHDVPVLKITRPANEDLKAVVFGYACHATVLNIYEWNGDYPGFAQAELERRHPGATALFFAGCGGDINPLPRRTVELAQHYGARLADAVSEVLAKPGRPLTGSFAGAYATIPLAFARIPSAGELREIAQSDGRGSTVNRPKHLLRVLDREGALPATYPYPVQVWRLGRELTWVALGGEVVVDYSLRLKRELGPNTWVAGYSNDVMAYIPSERVLEEGGYEGATSMNVYAQPSAWAPGLEEQIVGQVKELAGSLR